jgi:membrane fusion protein (multidrug efflux system)
MKTRDEKLEPEAGAALPPRTEEVRRTAVIASEPAGQRPGEGAITKGRGRAFLIFFVVLLIAAVAGLMYWRQAQQFESTDDAQVEAHLNPVSARIDGSIAKVYVENNQVVRPGDPLVDLDPRDFQVALNQARAQLSEARSMVTAQQPNVPITEVENATNLSTGESSVAGAQAALGAAEHDRDSAAAKLAESEANNARAQADLERYNILISKEEVSRQEYDQIAATAKAQAATVAANQAAVQSAARVVDQRRAQVADAQSRLAQYSRTAPQQVAIRQANVRSQQANAENIQAQVEQAQLNLTYTKIVAPVAGIVMKRSAEVGARITAGQPLLVIVQLGDLWVTADFKETQLRRIQPGQPARIHVDALNLDFDGYVENVGGGTGSVISVLPPENATGNYVKVVQRIPIKLRFKPNQAGLDRLRAGMSVEPDVRVGR